MRSLHVITLHCALVQVLKAGTSSAEQETFMKEGRRMVHFDHRHVVRLLGIVRASDNSALRLHECSLFGTDGTLSSTTLPPNDDPFPSHSHSPPLLSDVYAPIRCHADVRSTLMPVATS